MMLSLYDIQLKLSVDATITDVLKLKDHFKALKIQAIGLDQGDFNPSAEELSFSIYGDFGPFMMKRMIEECTANIFPGSVVCLSQRG